MSEGLRSVLVGTSGLTVAAVGALALTLLRAPHATDPASLRHTLRVTAVAIAVQALHCLEELATGFHERFPVSFGLAPWSETFFVAFNASWIVIWGVSLAGIAANVRAALLPVWFLAIGCAGNAVAHPLFALRDGGYFPGLVTSPIAGVAGVLLLRQLVRATRSLG